MGWNFLSIPKLQRLGLKLNHVSTCIRGTRSPAGTTLDSKFQYVFIQVSLARDNSTPIFLSRICHLKSLPISLKIYLPVFHIHARLISDSFMVHVGQPISSDRVTVLAETRCLQAWYCNLELKPSQEDDEWIYEEARDRNYTQLT